MFPQIDLYGLATKTHTQSNHANQGFSQGVPTTLLITPAGVEERTRRAKPIGLISPQLYLSCKERFRLYWGYFNERRSSRIFKGQPSGEELLATRMTSAILPKTPFGT